MYVFNALVTDENMKGKEQSVIRKIRMNAGLRNVFLICLSESNDYFDILNGFQLKQRRFPKDNLYIMGMASSSESAIELAASMYYSFVGIYETIEFKKNLVEKKDQLFRRR